MIGFYFIFCDKQSNLMAQFCLIRRRMKVCWGDGWIWMLFRVSVEVEEEEKVNCSGRTIVIHDYDEQLKSGFEGNHSTFVVQLYKSLGI
ncbi:hypothetical protein Hanom_Chr16g01479731 [Helianthus anomalus]